jgi:hypothetical protein
LSLRVFEVPEEAINLSSETQGYISELKRACGSAESSQWICDTGTFDLDLEIDRFM